MSVTPPLPLLPPPSPLPPAQNDANKQGSALHPSAATNFIGAQNPDATTTGFLCHSSPHSIPLMMRQL